MVKMSGNKKKAYGDNAERSSESEDSQTDDENNPDIYTDGERIQVDFEGRNPQDSDFHGIKTLLQQLFLKAHVNLSELSELIIGQGYVGSVVKQSDADPEDVEVDEEMDDVNDVFGITSVVNLTTKQNLGCVQQLRTLLTELSQEHATDKTNMFIRQILGDESKAVGLIINERFVNIPAEISVPLLESLNNEVQRAAKKNMPFNFAYYILICKLYKPEEKDRYKNAENIWSNPEEEVIFPEAIASFEFSVKKDSDSGHGGHWLEEDDQMTPYRKVLVLDATKFDDIINTVKSYVEQV